MKNNLLPTQVIRENKSMSSNGNVKTAGQMALVAHLLRFPEDLRYIRRLITRFGVSSQEVDQALDVLDRSSRVSDHGAMDLPNGRPQ